MSDVPYDIDEPYRFKDPLDMDDARQASRRVAEIRREAEQAHRDAVRVKAEKEVAYRMAYSAEIVRLKNGGEASTTAAERARGEDAVRDHLKAFRIAEGMVDAAKERLRGIEGERSLLKSLIDASVWMMRGPEARTPDGPVIGAGMPSGSGNWRCPRCGLRNEGWAATCGRCAFNRQTAEVAT